MDGKTLAKVSLIAVALAAAGYFGFKNSQSFSAENPDISIKKFWFICSNEKCNSGFQVPVSETRAYKAAHDGAEVPCPVCGSAEVKRGGQCPSCKKLFLLVGHGSVPKTCPNCNARIPHDPDD